MTATLPRDAVLTPVCRAAPGIVHSVAGLSVERDDPRRIGELNLDSVAVVSNHPGR